MKQTTYTCDWCKDEIEGEKAEIKVGKRQFHMCESCYWDMLYPTIRKATEYKETKNEGEE